MDKAKPQQPAPVYLRFKTEAEVAERFQKDSAKMNMTHSQYLSFLVDLSQTPPHSEWTLLVEQVSRSEEKLKKMLLIVMAILRGMERTQTKPLLAMMQLLFQEEGKHQTQGLVEKKPGAPLQVRETFKQKQDDRLQLVQEVISKVTPSRSGFGRSILELKMSREEFEKLKVQLTR